jgi:hypothetical protein
MSMAALPDEASPRQRRSSGAGTPASPPSHATPQPQGVPAPVSTTPMVHPSVSLRFADVILELRGIAAQAASLEGGEDSPVVRACRRAESLLRVLRAQFLDDVTGGGNRPPSPTV